MLTALDRNVSPPVIIKYGTGFTIGVVVDEKFLGVESHSLVNWLNTSPSHFLCNPNFGVISTYF